MPLLGVVVNRVHPEPVPIHHGGRGRRSGDASDLSIEFAARLLAVFEEQQSVARQEHAAIARLEEQTSASVVLVPELETDVHDLRGLRTGGELILPGFAEEPVEVGAGRRHDEENGRGR